MIFYAFFLRFCAKTPFSGSRGVPAAVEESQTAAPLAEKREQRLMPSALEDDHAVRIDLRQLGRVDVIRIVAVHDRNGDDAPPVFFRRRQRTPDHLRIRFRTTARPSRSLFPEHIQFDVFELNRNVAE